MENRFLHQRRGSIERLDWHQFGDPEAIARRFYQQPDFIWLDSASKHHVNSRHHILAWAPRLKLLTEQGQTKLVGQPQESATLSESDLQSPFAAMRQLAQQLHWQPATDNPAGFDGGWLGFWGYDLGRYLERLPNQAQADIDFPDMAVGWYEAALIIDQTKQQAYLIGERHACHHFKQQLEQSIPEPAPTPFKLVAPWSSNMSHAQYSDKFDAVQNYLLAGDCYQVNLAQRHQSQFQGEPFSAYLALRQHNAGPFSAYINNSKGQVLSLSPERFIECQQLRIETKPIKGTRPRGHDAISDTKQAQALQSAEKDRAENLMIVDLLRNDVSKVAAPGSVEVPVLFGIESFPSVHHMVSTVTAQLSEHHDVYDLLEGAFPGGSITGAPKIRAMEIIDELEPHRRNIYCGSIGYISVSEQMDTSITIRTLLCDNSQRIFCWAGGGLVADSECSAEYQETHDKVSRILPLLNDL
ncbi:aminodeoxychorismate synthase component I [Neiella sp. HB171785]|uniref:aminodeoxychorismate synthase n=1 Tax=Neiella litorisoli TaxID=2771431 RepID=A0A8J6R2P9_9GAMM|nr:aminodeoxychorismate synthase component I [Neiella litorisoli]MBD1389230.1 aminodeoxychorismate synthase component I [Neiella litorisoli]